MVKNILSRYLPKGSAPHNVALLVGGSAVGQLIMILAIPILTRLYTPEEFGVLAVYTATLGIISTVASFRYELAIPQARTNVSAANVLVLCVLCVFITTTSLIVFLAAFFQQIPVWLNIPIISPFLWLIPIGVFLSGMYQVFNYWAIREQYFMDIATTKLQQGAGGVLMQVGLGVFQLGPVGLILGGVVGQSAGLIRLIRVAYKRDLGLLSRVSWKRIKQTSRVYKNFPKYTTFAALANTSSRMLPPIMLASLFSTGVAGFYLLANRVLQTPLSLISSSIGQVFHSKAALALKDGCLAGLLLKSSSELIKLTLLPLLVIGYYAKGLSVFLFGEEWSYVGDYVQWMIPWLFIQFIVSPLSIVVSLTNNQKAGLLAQVLFLIVRVSSLLIGGAVGGSDGAVLSYSISGFVVYFGLWLWMLRIVGVGFFEWISFLRKDTLMLKVALLGACLLMVFIMLDFGV